MASHVLFMRYTASFPSDSTTRSVTAVPASNMRSALPRRNRLSRLPFVGDLIATGDVGPLRASSPGSCSRSTNRARMAENTSCSSSTSSLAEAGLSHPCMRRHGARRTIRLKHAAGVKQQRFESWVRCAACAMRSFWNSAISFWACEECDSATWQRCAHRLPV